MEWFVLSPRGDGQPLGDFQSRKENDKSCILEKSLINMGRLDWSKEWSSTGRPWRWSSGIQVGRTEGRKIKLSLVADCIRKREGVKFQIQVTKGMIMLVPWTERWQSKRAFVWIGRKRDVNKSSSRTSAQVSLLEPITVFTPELPLCLRPHVQCSPQIISFHPHKTSH